MSQEQFEKEHINEIWYWYLTGDVDPDSEFLDNYLKSTYRIQKMLGLLPGDPRCFECDVPLSGLAGEVSKLFGFRPSSFSPRLCNACETSARRYEGGAEVELSMLFADIRGSTALAEDQGPFEFSRLVQRFYKTVSDILIEYNAMVNRLMGDQVIGLFVPRFAGREHARVAVDAALDILRATGHNEPGGPWVPVGVGVHTGMAFVGVVGSKDGVNEIAVLGNAANLAARLSSQAAAGEVVVSEASAESAHLADESSEMRSLELKGISQPVPVRFLRVNNSQPTHASH